MKLNQCSKGKKNKRMRWKGCFGTSSFTFTNNRNPQFNYRRLWFASVQIVLGSLWEPVHRFGIWYPSRFCFFTHALHHAFLSLIILYLTYCIFTLFHIIESTVSRFCPYESVIITVLGHLNSFSPITFEYEDNFWLVELLFNSTPTSLTLWS